MFSSKVKIPEPRTERLENAEKHTGIAPNKQKRFNKFT